MRSDCFSWNLRFIYSVVYLKCDRCGFFSCRLVLIFFIRRILETTMWTFFRAATSYMSISIFNMSCNFHQQVPFRMNAIFVRTWTTEGVELVHANLSKVLCHSWGTARMLSTSGENPGCEGAVGSKQRPGLVGSWGFRNLGVCFLLGRLLFIQRSPELWSLSTGFVVVFRRGHGLHRNPIVLFCYEFSYLWPVSQRS